MQRYLTNFIKDDLTKKMVFLGGPRQVGKTTVAFDILKNAQTSFDIESHPGYLNWDNVDDRKTILKLELPTDQKLIIFDEIHKYKNWRNLIKGAYDKNKSKHSFLVTGSARLDYYRRGGDSLQGRYHYYRLHPFSLGELIKSGDKTSIADLLKFGGFPEPLFSKNPRDYKRWQRERISRVLREDLQDLEKVMEVSQLQLLSDAIPSKVGSPLSIQSLSEDLQVAHKTISRWLKILENLYLSFRISPYGAPKIKAVKKEQKIYLWDWSLCENDEAKFENLVASQLLKYCHFIEDTEGDEMELRYIRDVEKREVDFIVVKNKKPMFAVECKLEDANISPHLKYFSERVDCPKWYQVILSKKHYEKDKIEVIPFQIFVEKLGLP